MKRVLVTGGSGFFGSILVKTLLERGYEVKILDLFKDKELAKNCEYFQADIRDFNFLLTAAKNCDVIHHNVAQVPLAKNKKLFLSVNLSGTENILNAALKNLVEKVVYTSSSAVFGIPESNPVRRDTKPRPLEAYGRAKYLAEKKCIEFKKKGVNVSIVRPRTIMGLGRLGIFQILFEWIYQGRNIPVLGSGENLYQFVHAKDLSEMCIKVGESKTADIYNCGATNFSSMRETLEDLTRYAGTKSQVKSIPMNVAVPLMKISSALRISPLGDYHSLMYGRSMFFDVDAEMKELSWRPKYSNFEMFRESYDWYLKHRNQILHEKTAYSLHRSRVKQGALEIFSRFL